MRIVLYCCKEPYNGRNSLVRPAIPGQAYIAGTPEIQNQFRQWQWQQLPRSPATLKIVMIQVQTGLSAIQVVWGVWALESELLQCPFNRNKTTHYFYITLPKKTCLSPWTNKNKHTHKVTHAYLSTPTVWRHWWPFLVTWPLKGTLHPIAYPSSSSFSPCDHGEKIYATLSSSLTVEWCYSLSARPDLPNIHTAINMLLLLLSIAILL